MSLPFDRVDFWVKTHSFPICAKNSFIAQGLSVLGDPLTDYETGSILHIIPSSSLGLPDART